MRGIQVLFICLSAVYILSPIDAMPGLPFDDIIALILLVIICGKAGINPFRDEDEKE